MEIAMSMLVVNEGTLYEVNSVSDTGRIAVKRAGLYTLSSATIYFNKKALSPFFLQIGDTVVVKTPALVDRVLRVKNIYYEGIKIMILGKNNESVSLEYLTQNITDIN